MSQTIRLREYQDWCGPLADADAEFVATALSCQCSIRRALRGEEYILNPNQFVGVVILPSGTRLEVVPKVPIASLFHMLAVAYRLPDPFREDVAGFDDFDDLFHFVAGYFADLVEQRIRAGLVRAYMETEENLPTVRGRIVVVEDVRRNFALRQRTYCRYTEFTWDVPENQIIRQVVHLLRGYRFPRSLRQCLFDLDVTMGEVSVTSYPGSVVDRFAYGRFNDDYQPIHRLCRLFLDGMSLTNQAGEVGFRTFLIDMNRLFELFITQLLEDRVGPHVTLMAQRPTHLGRDQQLAMRPDIIIRRNGQAIVIGDCKYKRTAEGEFHNHDYYQMLAYCTALETERGVLIYPKGEQDTETSIAVAGSRVVIDQRVIDLSLAGQAFAEECDRLVCKLTCW